MMGKKCLKVDFLIIDPQNDFMDVPGAPLRVPGATDDMKRAAEMIKRLIPKINDFHVTLDSHQRIDIGHPPFWRNHNGDMPTAFTQISTDDIRNRIWYPKIPSDYERVLRYSEALETGGKYKIMAWPPHCEIGTPGHNIQSDLQEALLQWQVTQMANVDFVTKGTNAYTEHYGALMAEVPDPNDPSTQINTALLNVLQQVDIIATFGEALSHCLMATIQQIADNIGDAHISKFHIIRDCTSPIPKIGDGPDFPQIAEDWLNEMQARGMKVTTSTEFLS